MERSRRKFILQTLGLMSSTVFPALTIASTNTQSWKKVCKKWMQVLLPADEYGPGGDCPDVWENLDRIMKEKPDVGQWIIMVFNSLENTKTPSENFEIERLLKSSNSHAKFLQFFQEFLLDSYYSSAVGWEELGFTHPIQPNGYPIKN